MKILFLFFLSLPVWSEIPSFSGNKNDVGFPLKFPSPVTGTFAEIRNHNLHLGTDFKAYGLNGHAAMATTDGYVEEITESKIGYGLSLLLNSPSLRLRSKYGHLHNLNGEVSGLEELRKSLSLLGEKEGFQVKLLPQAFPVKKGQIVAQTGESGSGISHLHLELRGEKGTWNPLSFPSFQNGDSFHPTILAILIEGEDTDYHRNAKEKSTGVYALSEDQKEEELFVQGKVRIRIAGFDRIQSRNKNNVYGMFLKKNGEVIFSRTFDYLPFEDGVKKHQYYDTNRSSLSPPLYYYHLYEQSKDFRGEGYSLEIKEGEKLELIAGLTDAKGNVSSVNFTLIGKTPVAIPDKSKSVVLRNNEGNFKLDFSKSEISGKGKPFLKEWESSEIPFPIPKGIEVQGRVYQIGAKNFSWKGEAVGEWKLNLQPNESLFFWDSSLSKFQWIAHKKSKNSISFSPTKLGFLFVGKDLAPPSIFPMATLSRDVELPNAKDNCLEVRYFTMSDLGTGFRSTIELTLDGQSYPYEYDPDRKAARIEIPKRWGKDKKLFLLEARAFDFAGNASQHYSDLIFLTPEKDCP